MTTPVDLEARVARLEDLEAIKQLKYRYFRCLDTKQWDEMAGCFTADATAAYGDGRYTFTGRDAIMQFLRDNMGVQSGTWGHHHGHHPEIEVTSATTARGTWALHNYLLNPRHQRGVRMACYYRDEYVKADGAWKIRHTGYTHLYHEEWSRSDTPSLRVLAPAEGGPR